METKFTSQINELTNITKSDDVFISFYYDAQTEICGWSIKGDNDNINEIISTLHTQSGDIDGEEFQMKLLEICLNIIGNNDKMFQLFLGSIHKNKVRFDRIMNRLEMQEK